MQRVSVASVKLQDLPAKLLRIGEASGMMVFARDPDRLANVNQLRFRLGHPCAAGELHTIIG